MSRPIAVEINCETKEVIERPYTDEELAAAEIAAQEAAERRAQMEAEREAREAALESARTKLATLGLSDEEINALVS